MGAIFKHYSDEQHAQWEAWVAQTPPVVQKLCAKYFPNVVYMRRGHPELVFISQYFDDGTVAVKISEKLNPRRTISPLPDQEIVGVDPTTLVVAEVPHWFKVQ